MMTRKGYYALHILASRAVNNLLCDWGMEPAQINRGKCRDFMTALLDVLEGDGARLRTTEVGNLPIHYWTEIGGRHYDAECPYGVTDCAFLPIFQRILLPDLEFLTNAAVQQNDEVREGRRHSQIMLAWTQSGGYNPMRARQGFATNMGRFVSREEGLKIATAAAQVDPDMLLGSILTSEDLWP